MLGIQDPFVLAAYVLCVVAAIMCVVYGAMNWNRGDEAPQAQDARWAASEDKVEENI